MNTPASSHLTRSFCSVYFNLLRFLGAAALLTASLMSADLPAPKENAVAVAPLNPSLHTIFVVGDSTAARNGDAAIGWGVPFGDYFDPSKINYANRARGGRSSKTFFTEGLWEKVAAEIKPGDIVFLQFGHNDGGPIDKDKARGSLPGLGEEQQDVTLASGEKQTVHTFGWYMRKFISDTKAKGALPIVLSPTVRAIWEKVKNPDGTFAVNPDGSPKEKIEPGPGAYPQWSAEVAKATQSQFLDLTTLLVDTYTRLGVAKVKEFFPKDHTHTNQAGASLTAWTVLAALKEAGKPPLGDALSETGKAVSRADPGLAANAVMAELRPLPEPADPKLPTLFLIGDSTVRNGRGDGGGGQWGWGEPLVAFFDTTKVNVVNRAVGGLSSRTYYTQYWPSSLALMKRGDFVVMQFGHNDNGALNDISRARGTIKGIGEQTEEIDNLLTKKHEVVYSYGGYLRKFIAEARAKGVTPIVCSLIPRKTWKDGKIVRESYADWAAAVAKAEGVGFIDLNALIATRYEQLGEAKVEPLFGDPHTHTSLAGAQLNAECVVAGLKALKIKMLSDDFSEKGKTVNAAGKE